METPELEQSMLGFLEGSGVLAALEQARAQAGEKLLPAPFLVEIDLLALAQSDPELAQLFLENMRQFHQLLQSVLVAAGKLHPAERLWVRPAASGLLAESASCSQALNLLRCQPGRTVALHGICCAATAIFQQRHSRTHVCSSCGAEVVVLEGECAPACCGAAFVREDSPRATTMQTQVIYLAEETSVSVGITQLGEPTLAVRLHDDLCGRARVGDRLLVLGVGRHVLALDGASAVYGCRPAVQLDAVTVEVLPAAGPASCQPGALLRVQHPPAAISGLEGLLGAMCCCFDAPCSPLLQLALLLSAAAAGVGAVELAGEDGEAEGEEEGSYVQRAACSSRVQVNLLLLTKGPEPHLQRLLQKAAAGLCQHSAMGSADTKQLLPRLFAKYVEPGLQLQVPLAMGGQLALANSGVLLLESCQLGAKQGAALADCLRAGTVMLMPNVPELAVRLTPSLWCLVQDQDLGKLSGKGGGSQLGAISTRAAAKYGAQLLSQFDIHLQCSEDPEDLDLWAEQLLCTAQRQQGAAQAACRGGAGGGEHAAVAEVECRALAALQAHLQRAVAMPQPRMTEDAMALLSAYFLLIRMTEESPKGALESMARVATACARLCCRRQALVFPDAVVAVMFTEEQIMCRGGTANYWAKWRHELERGTELTVCLEGLHSSLQESLATAFVGAAEE